MVDTRVDLASRALVRVGARPIDSFDDGSNESTAVAHEYEAIVDNVLSQYRWRFASKQALLNRVEQTPIGRWAYAWQVPADCRAITTVTFNGRPIAYDRYDDKLFTDAADGLVIDYVYRPDETLWPGYFRELVVQELAAALAMGLIRDADMASSMQQSTAARQWPIARSADSQSQTTRRVAPSRLVAAWRL